MNKPIIIIEGQDKTGKTTLVNRLSNWFGPSVIKHHSSSPPGDLKYPDNYNWEFENYTSLMKTFHEVSYDHPIILDRFHLGMYVYGRKFRKYPPELSVSDIELHMPLYNNTLLILLTDNPEEIMKRDDSESHEKTVGDFYETSINFELEFQKSRIPNKLHINISENGGFRNTYSTVIAFIEDTLFWNKL